MFNKILSVFLIVLVLTAYPAFAQKPLSGSQADLVKQGSAPSNPSTSSYTTIYIDSSGMAHLLQSTGNNSTLATLAGTETLTNKTIAGGSNTISGITETMQSLSDITTNNSSTSNHGYLKKLNNDAAYYMDGTGNWSIPSGGGGGSSVLSAITAATGSNDINNANNAQIWRWNTLAGATGFLLSSSSTAAASNAQKLFSVTLSGANATSTQTTYAGYFTNTHTGTSSINIGSYFGASGASQNYDIHGLSKILIGTVSSSQVASEVGLEIVTTSTSPTIRFERPGGSEYKLGVFSDNVLYLTNNNGPTNLGSSTNGLTLNSSGYFRIYNRLGIGTDASYPLHVVGVSRLAGETRVTNSSGHGLQITDDGTYAYLSALTSSDGARDLRILGQSIDFYSGTSYTSRMVLNSSGYLVGSSVFRLGIGVTPSYKLHVNGESRFVGSSGHGIQILDDNSNAYISALSSTDTSRNLIINGETIKFRTGTSYADKITIGTTGGMTLAQDTITSDISAIAITSTINSGGTTLNGLIKGNLTDSASSSSTLLLNLLTNSVSKFSVRKDGYISAASDIYSGGYITANTAFATGGGTYLMQANGTYNAMAFVNYSGAILNIIGGLATNPRTTNQTLSGGANDSGILTTNTGATGSVTSTLPAATVNLHYYYVVTTAQNLVVDAAGTDIIRIGSSSSTAGGNITSNTIGSMAHCVCAKAGEWTCLTEGSWTPN